MLQRSTYENTKDIHKVSRNIDQTTNGIAANTTDIVHEAREIIVSVVGATAVIEPVTFQGLLG